MNERIKTKRNNNTEINKASTIDSSVLTSGIPNSVLCDVMSGSKRATSEMMGHRTDLAPSIQAKMSKAFGMDFSNLQLYRSDVMKDTKTQGLASGNKVVLSSDINLNTLEGQSILGHELSHIHAQSMGEGLGHSGLYDNAALEQKADSEGMMAAHGMNIFGESSAMSESLGMASFDSLTPIGSGMAATAGAPMQARKLTKTEKAKMEEQKSYANPDDYFKATADDSLSLEEEYYFDQLEEKKWEKEKGVKAAKKKNKISEKIEKQKEKVWFIIKESNSLSNQMKYENYFSEWNKADENKISDDLLNNESEDNSIADALLANNIVENENNNNSSDDDNLDEGNFKINDFLNEVYNENTEDRSIEKIDTNKIINKIYLEEAKDDYEQSKNHPKAPGEDIKEKTEDEILNDYLFTHKIDSTDVLSGYADGADPRYADLIDEIIETKKKQRKDRCEQLREENITNSYEEWKKRLL